MIVHRATRRRLKTIDLILFKNSRALTMWLSETPSLINTDQFSPGIITLQDLIKAAPQCGLGDGTALTHAYTMAPASTMEENRVSVLFHIKI